MQKYQSGSNLVKAHVGAIQMGSVDAYSLPVPNLRSNESVRLFQIRLSQPTVRARSFRALPSGCSARLSGMKKRSPSRPTTAMCAAISSRRETQKDGRNVVSYSSSQGGRESRHPECSRSR
jgi:hypothetical protein